MFSVQPPNSTSLAHSSGKSHEVTKQNVFSPVTPKRHHVDDGHHHDNAIEPIPIALQIRITTSSAVHPKGYWHVRPSEGMLKIHIVMRQIQFLTWHPRDFVKHLLVISSIISSLSSGHVRAPGPQISPRAINLMTISAMKITAKTCHFWTHWTLRWTAEKSPRLGKKSVAPVPQFLQTFRGFGLQKKMERISPFSVGKPSDSGWTALVGTPSPSHWFCQDTSSAARMICVERSCGFARGESAAMQTSSPEIHEFLPPTNNGWYPHLDGIPIINGIPKWGSSSFKKTFTNQ